MPLQFAVIPKLITVGYVDSGHRNFQNSFLDERGTIVYDEIIGTIKHDTLCSASCRDSAAQGLGGAGDEHLVVLPDPFAVLATPVLVGQHLQALIFEAGFQPVLQGGLLFHYLVEDLCPLLVLLLVNSKLLKY